MKKTFKYKLAAVGSVVLMVAAVTVATAQNPDLSDRVDSLEERVTVLEGFHTSEPEPTPTATETEPEPEPTETETVPEDIATWEGVVASSATQPTITIHDSVYPNADGVQFLVNGEVDDRCTCRPNGYDATGPQDDSTFHIYPDIELVPGDVVTGRWESGGVAYEDSETVPESEPEPTSTETEPEPEPTETETVDPTGFPDATTTGLSDPSAINQTVTGKVVLGEGETLENAEVLDGFIDVQGDNVTIRNVWIHGSSGAHYGIDTNPSTFDVTGLVIENVFMELHNYDRPVGVYGRGFTITNSHITGARTGVQLVGSAHIEHNYVHDSWFDDTSHGTGMSVHGGSDIVFRNNHIVFDGDRGGSSALSLYGNVAPLDNILVENNLFYAHAAYCFKGGWSDAKEFGNEVTNIKVFDNHFSTQFHPECGRSGPVSNWNGDAEGNEMSGNVWHETGEPLN